MAYSRLNPQKETSKACVSSHVYIYILYVLFVKGFHLFFPLEFRIKGGKNICLQLAFPPIMTPITLLLIALGVSYWYYLWSNSRLNGNNGNSNGIGLSPLNEFDKFIFSFYGVIHRSCSGGLISAILLRFPGTALP